MFKSKLTVYVRNMARTERIQKSGEKVSVSPPNELLKLIPLSIDVHLVVCIMLKVFVQVIVFGNVYEFHTGGSCGSVKLRDLPNL